MMMNMIQVLCLLLIASLSQVRAQVVSFNQVIDREGEYLRHFANTTTMSSEGDVLITTSSNAVYVYDRDRGTWEFNQANTLNNIYGVQASVSGDGDRVLLYYGAEEPCVYERNPFNQYERSQCLTDIGSILPEVPAVISGDGDRIVVGMSKGKYDSGENCAYVYRYNACAGDFHFLQKITINDEVTRYYEETSVAMSYDGEILVLGGYYLNPDGTYAGDVTIMKRKRGGFYSQHGEKILGEGKFGGKIALSGTGTSLVIGNPDYENGFGFIQAVSISNEGWSLDTRVYAKDLDVVSSTTPNFGSSVAIDENGNRMVVGATGEYDNKGAAFVLDRHEDADGMQSWQVVQKMYVEDGHLNFGKAVSIAGNGHTITVSAGAEQKDGEIYVYQVIGGPGSGRLLESASTLKTLRHLESIESPASTVRMVKASPSFSDSLLIGSSAAATPILVLALFLTIRQRKSGSSSPKPRTASPEEDEEEEDMAMMIKKKPEYSNKAKSPVTPLPMVRQPHDLEIGTMQVPVMAEASSKPAPIHRMNVEDQV